MGVHWFSTRFVSGSVVVVLFLVIVGAEATVIVAPVSNYACFEVVVVAIIGQCFNGGEGVFAQVVVHLILETFVAVLHKAVDALACP